MAESKEILEQLKPVLNQLRGLPYPHVPNPEGCKKRASVAVIIRVRPAFQPAPTPNESIIDLDNDDPPASDIDDFFARSWVQTGEADVLFIKRAGRAGDRWSGHIALPGGKRDPEDESDLAAAIRETREEVGLDLSVPECLEAGNLPERIVATTFGRVPLMVISRRSRIGTLGSSTRLAIA
jgi:8-oxo-dGTP pyrophosphatase MutT (NUDIX family)